MISANDGCTQPTAAAAMLPTMMYSHSGLFIATRRLRGTSTGLGFFSSSPPSSLSAFAISTSSMASCLRGLRLSDIQREDFFPESSPPFATVAPTAAAPGGCPMGGPNSTSCAPMSARAAITSPASLRAVSPRSLEPRPRSLEPRPKSLEPRPNSVVSFDGFSAAPSAPSPPLLAPSSGAADTVDISCLAPTSPDSSMSDVSSSSLLPEAAAGGASCSACICSRTSDAYVVSPRMSSSWVPVSTSSPRLTTAIRSASWIVDSLCAMIMVVRPTTRLSSAFCTRRSLSVSSALVASSSSMTCGFLRIARAIAMRCFCPPLRLRPRSPTLVWYALGRRLMKSFALAALAAAITSSSLASGRPMRMFSKIVVAKSVGSWLTRPVWARSHLRSSWRRSIPSSSTTPESGS
mmetsp:Transcript_28510/g.84409  ORF Transcript_28510/g.84409 Transcript_28510/m.84409 type:complete len:406 (-) Transcript_28510:1522-2739(-)